MAVFGAISAAIAAVSSWTISLGAAGSFAVGNFLIRSVVQIGLSRVFSGFAGNSGPGFSIQGKLRGGGDIPRSLVFGKTDVPGSLVYHSEWGEAGGTPNAYYTQVIALNDLPVSGFPGVFVHGVRCTMGGTAHPDFGFPITEYSKGGEDYLWVKFYDGTQTVADPFLVSKVSSVDRPYESTRVGVGVAYFIMTARIKEDLFTGFPEVKPEVQGTKLYDISKDSTNGGSGLHRWNDMATWGGDGDDYPVVQGYNIMRGLSWNSVWLYGLQTVTEAQLPAVSWVAGVNKCRAQIQGADGLEATFRSAGEIAVSAEIRKSLNGILITCAGRMPEVAGAFKIQLGAADPAVMSITDGDILTDYKQSFIPFWGLAKLVNGLVATYPNPEEAYATTSTPPLNSAAHEVEDGNRRLMRTISLELVPYPEQAQRLVSAALAEARRARRHTFGLPARYYPLEPGDVIDFTSARNGYAAKLFRVEGVIDLPNCDVIIEILEVDPADYSFNTATDYTPPAPNPLVVVRPPAQSVVGFVPSGVDITDSAAAARRPGAQMAWTATGIDDVAGVQFQIRVQATAAVVSSFTVNDFSLGSIITEQGLVADEDYEARAIYIPGSGREVAWTSWAAFKTNDVRLGYGDLVAAIASDIADAAKIPVVATLPANDVPFGPLVFLTTDRQVYRWNTLSMPSSVWTAEVASTQIIGQLTAGQIGAGVIGASHINVTELSAITATIGTLRTATSGERVEISDDLIQVFDASDNVVIKIGDLS